MVNYSKMFSKDQNSLYDNSQVDNSYDSTGSVDENSAFQEQDPMDDVRTGFVANCTKAYIRELPSRESDHLTIVEKGDELLVEYSSEEDWYKVTTQCGAEGYIMKELVALS